MSDDPLAPRAEEAQDPHFEPVIKLTEQVETKTHEEDEDALFKMRAKLFRFDPNSSEWKERGTGDVRLLQHRQSHKVRLVMRRDKTLKVCANHALTIDMKLQPNIGSDRSWVWKVAADYAEGEPTAETLAIRFANSDNAAEFKKAFEEGQGINASVAAGTYKKDAAETPEPPAAVSEDTPAEEKAAEPVADAPQEESTEDAKE